MFGGVNGRFTDKFRDLPEITSSPRGTMRNPQRTFLFSEELPPYHTVSEAGQRCCTELLDE